MTGAVPKIRLRGVKKRFGEKVVLNGVDLGRYGPRPRDAALARELGVEGRFVVGYLGTHGMAHSLPKVLEAAERLRGRGDIAFLFAGSGAERGTVERIVAERGLANVVLVPRQPRERMAALWSLCDLALVPLRDLPLFTTVIPSKIFEAMAMGVPVLLCTPEGEASRIVRDAGGVCLPPEDPVALADAVVALCGDPARRGALRSSALAAAPRYSREAQAAVMLEVLAGAARR